jgi:hypothetical protein
LVKVTTSGLVRPSPKLVNCRSTTRPLNPDTRLPLGVSARIVTVNGTPASW